MPPDGGDRQPSCGIVQNFTVMQLTLESLMQKSSKARSYRIREDALMSAIAALRAKLAGTDGACEAIGLFLVMVDLAARSGSVRENELERHVGEMVTKQDALDALESAGLISIRRTSNIPGVGFEIMVADLQVLEGWRECGL